MKLISHNSWTFAKPKKWWMKVINFTARCQSADIKTQYEKYGIRAFDLRIRFDKSRQLQVVHGHITYNIDNKQLFKDLSYLNDKGGCTVRLLHDVRNYEQFNTSPADEFNRYAQYYETMFPDITFFGGNNLYNDNIEYHFKDWFSIEGKYGSVIKPTWFWGLFPQLYAYLYNKENIKTEVYKDYLMVDFVNYR